MISNRISVKIKFLLTALCAPPAGHRYYFYFSLAIYQRLVTGSERNVITLKWFFFFHLSAVSAAAFDKKYKAAYTRLSSSLGQDELRKKRVQPPSPKAVDCRRSFHPPLECWSNLWTYCILPHFIKALNQGFRLLPSSTCSLPLYCPCGEYHRAALPIFSSALVTKRPRWLRQQMQKNSVCACPNPAVVCFCLN